VSDAKFLDSVPDEPPCPKCRAVGTVIMRGVLWLGVHYTHGHCHACGHAWVEPNQDAPIR